SQPDLAINAPPHPSSSQEKHGKFGPYNEVEIDNKEQRSSLVEQGSDKPDETPLDFQEQITRHSKEALANQFSSEATTVPVEPDNSEQAPETPVNPNKTEPVKPSISTQAPTAQSTTQTTQSITP